MEPAAASFMALSKFKWLKEIQPEKASRTTSKDPKKFPKITKVFQGCPKKRIG
jgi:hypothetical protein